MLRWLLNRFQRRKIIIIAPRWVDIWAGSVGNKDEWGSGKSVYDALGNLIFNHQKEFRVDIQMGFGDGPISPLKEPYVTITEREYNMLLDLARWSQK